MNSPTLAELERGVYMTTLSDLVRLQEEATPGPWESSVSDWHTDKVFHGPQIVVQSCMDSAESEANMEFIAAARNFDLKGLQTQYEAMREFIRNAPHGSRCMDTPDDPCLCGLSAIRKKLEMDNA